MVERADARALLERAPSLLRDLYTDLPDAWLHASDAGEWSAHTVLVHMLTVEDHAWVQRIEAALEHPGTVLPPIDRGGPDPTADVAEMLDRFAALRRANLARLDELELQDQTAIHSVLGSVTVDEILATWTVHDLNHIAQAMAAIAGRYREDVGPFIPNLGILGPPG